MNPRPALAGLASTLVLASACRQVEPAPPSAAQPVEATARALRPSLASLSQAELDALGRPYELVEGEPMITVLELDAIPALDLPDFHPAAEADAFMDPAEPVLGVVGRDGTAKCYSAWQLDAHEIVNDQLDGQAIAATW